MEPAVIGIPPMPVQDCFSICFLFNAIFVIHWMKVADEAIDAEDETRAILFSRVANAPGSLRFFGRTFTQL